MQKFFTWVFELLVLVSLTLSVVALFRTSKNSDKIDEVYLLAVSNQKQIVEMSEKLDKRLDAMQAQLDFIAKYSEANYYHFYGDVDGRGSTIKTTNKSNSKSK